RGPTTDTPNGCPWAGAGARPGPSAPYKSRHGLVEKASQHLRLVEVADEVRAADHGPGAESEVVEPGVDESCDAPLGPRAVDRPVGHGVVQARIHVVLASCEIGLGVYRDVASFVAQHVVVMEVAVHEPVTPRLQIVVKPPGKQQQTALGRPISAFGKVEPTRHVVTDPSERRSRRL